MWMVVTEPGESLVIPAMEQDSLDRLDSKDRLAQRVRKESLDTSLRADRVFLGNLA